MTEGMKRSVIIILTGIAALVLSVNICTAAFAPEFEMMPLSMKTPSDATPYNDEGFIIEADSMVNKISNSTIPTGTKLSEVTDAYYRLIMENVSPEFLDTANNIVGYLFYTSQAGSTYKEYHDYLKSVSRTSDGSEYYTLVDQYTQVAAEFWNRISDRYPNATMYVLPSASAPMPTDESSTDGNILKGLETGIPMTQKLPDPTAPDQTESVKTSVTRWFEDYVENAEPDEVDPLTNEVKTTAGHLFLTGEGLQWADSTYMDLISKNVAEDFYEKAQYISAFFYLISQARESYQDYIDDRTYVSSVSYGDENYEKAKKYYNEAEKSIEYFKDVMSGTNNTLPVFPQFGEVALAGSEWDNYGAFGYITDSMAESLGWNAE